MTRNSLIDSRYESFESDFIVTRQYVDLEKDFLNVTSQAYFNLFLSLGDEFSSYITEFCSKFSKNLNKSKFTILDFYKCSIENCGCLPCESVLLKDKKWIIYPWKCEKINGKISLKWWDDYNSIKHAYLRPYNNECLSQKYTLENVLYAFSALTIIKGCIRESTCNNLTKELNTECQHCSNLVSNENIFRTLKYNDFYLSRELFFVNEKKNVQREEYEKYLQQYTKLLTRKVKRN